MAHPPNRSTMEQERAPSHADNGSSFAASAIAVIAIVVGAVLRVIEFTRGRPLWLDEAMLSLNIAARPISALARPLDYDQSAPIAYLWIERLLVSAGGVSERTLRLLPFVAGVALVGLTWFVMRRLTNATTAAIATLLIALSISLVSFSAEAKQYGVDPLVAVLIVWLAVRVADAPDDVRPWRQLVWGGIGCLLLSQPAAFVLGGAVCALVLDPSVRRSRVARRNAVIAGGAWLFAFAAMYFGLYRATAQSAYMHGFWEGTFLDPRASDLVGRLEMFSTAVFSAPTLAGLKVGPGWLMPFVWVGGIVALMRRRVFVGGIAAAPLALATVACAFGYYAVMDRLFLFAAPLTLLSYAAVIAWVVELRMAIPQAPRLIGATAALAALAAPTHARRIAHPVFYAVGKQIIADVDSMSRGEPVYVAARSFPLWIFYTTDWRAPDEARLRWAASIAGASGPAHNNAFSRGRVRAEDARGLMRSYRGRVEIIGLPTGRQYRTSTRTLSAALTPSEYALPLQPDTGWAQVEVDRMASAAHARIWVFGSHMFSLDSAEPELVAELQRRGVRLVMERRQGSTVAYYVEFPSGP